MRAQFNRTARATTILILHPNVLAPVTIDARRTRARCSSQAVASYLPT